MWGHVRPVSMLAAFAVTLSVVLVLPGGGGLVWATEVAGSSVLVVNTVTDRPRHEGDVDCTVPGRTCSLRAAVQEANVNPAFDAIVVPAGGYVLTRQGTHEDGRDGPLTLTSDITITGAGPGLTVIDGGWRVTEPGGLDDRVLDVVAGSSTLTGLTIKGGDARDTSGAADGRGGGVRILEGAALALEDVVVEGNRAVRGSSQGGGIHHSGTMLRLTRTVVRDNRANGQGGGIHSGGTLTITDSEVSSNVGGPGGGLFLYTPTLAPRATRIERTTVADNAATGSGGGIGAGGRTVVELIASTVADNTASTAGGGLAVFAGGDLQVENSTISGNVVTGTGGGGGIQSSSSVAPRVRYATVVGNTSPGTTTGGALHRAGTGPAFDVEGSILSSAQLPVCSNGAVRSLGHNLARDTSCALSAATDLPPAAPELGPLADNGGPTRTHALLAASPAIDAAAASGPECPALDQRGGGRPVGSRCDVGAFELGATIPDAPDPDPDPPGGVEDLTVRVGDSAVGLAWRPPTDDGGAPVTGYVVEIVPDPIDGSPTPLVTEASALIAGLVNGTEYTFTVRAINEAGAGPVSAPVVATPQLRWLAGGYEGAAGRVAQWDADGLERTVYLSVLANQGQPQAIAQGGDGRWVVVGGGGQIAYSDTVGGWQQAITSPISRASLHGVAHDGFGRWTAVGAVSRILTSVDGATWSLIEGPAGGYRDVTYGAGRWVAVGRDGLVATSLDGTTWTAVAYPHSGEIRAIAHGGGRWVAVGGGSEPEIATSTDGTTWTARPQPELSIRAMTDVAFGGGRWVGVSGANLVTSTDGGVTWARVTGQSLPTRNLMAVEHDRGTWLVVGDRVELRSTDGITWAVRRNEFRGPVFRALAVSRPLQTPPAPLAAVPPPPTPATVSANLVGLEVNQALQDWRNEVPLLARKPTAVRAFVELPPGDDPAALTGVLRGFRGGTELTWSPLTPVNVTGAVLAREDIRARRQVLEDSLNFRLPFSWLEGELELRFETPNALLSCSEGAKPAATCTAEVSFVESGPLDVTLVDAGWQTDATSPVVRPTAVDMTEQAQRLREAFPISGYRNDIRRMDNGFETKPTREDVLSALNAMRTLDGCLTQAGCERIYSAYMLGSGGGLASGRVSMSFAEGGEAVGARVHARNRVPHEVAHNLGIPHVVNAVNEGEEENRKYGWCGEDAGATSLDWPDFSEIAGSDRPTIGPLGQPDGEIWGLVPRFMGSDASLALVNPRTTFPMMSYCLARAAGQGRWIGLLNSTRLFTRLGGDSALTTAANLDVQVDEDPEVLVPHLLVRVTVPLADDAAIDEVAFDPTLRAELPVGSQPTSGDYELVLRGTDGAQLARVPFDVEELHPDGTDDPKLGQAIVPVVDPGTPLGALEVRLDGVVLATLTASEHTPTVTIDAPALGDVVGDDGLMRVRWTGADDDGDALRYTVRFSPDGTNSWQTLGVDLTGEELLVDHARLRGTHDAHLQVIVSDGINSSVAEVGPFTVVNVAPRVSVTAPVAGTAFAGDQLLGLSAVVDDPEDGELDGSSVTWSSDLDGAIGTGTEVTVDASTLVEGQHELTVTATDSAGATASATTTVLISRSFAALSLVVFPEGDATAVEFVDPPSLLVVDEVFDLRVRVVDSTGQPVPAAGVAVDVVQLAGAPDLEPMEVSGITDAGGEALLTGLRFTGFGGSAFLQLDGTNLDSSVLEVQILGEPAPRDDPLFRDRFEN